VEECLFFGGLSIAETADGLYISRPTVKCDWSIARVWLYREMQSHKPSDDQEETS
jgi:hypothetical protein